MRIGKECYPRVNSLVVLREEFDDWAVLFHPDTAEAVGINPVSVQIWKRLDGKHTIPEITKEISDLFSEVPETAEAEIQKFIMDLVDRGFAEITSDDRGTE